MGGSFANILRVLFVLAGMSATTAFQTVVSHRRYPTTALFSAQELSPVDEMCIENVAEYCLHESCDIEEYEALINQLEVQWMAVQARLYSSFKVLVSLNKMRPKNSFAY